MDSSPLNVGLVGYGIAGAVFHAPLISTTPGLRLAAVVTADPERRARASREHPRAALFADADALLAAAPELGLDLLVVASPNRTHVPLATAALEAGLPVVVDKPLAATAAEGERLVALARERGLLLSVFQNRRWDGDFRTVRQLLDSGRLGRVNRFESRFERWRPELTGAWRESGDPAAAGGVLYDLGAHLVDQALLLFGPAERVYAELDARRTGAATDDDSFVALTHADGTRSHLWMSATAGDLGPRFRVLGSRGAYVVHGLDGQEDALRAGRTPAEPGWGALPPEQWGSLRAGDAAEAVPTLPGSYQEYYAGLAEALHGRGPAPVDAGDAVAVLRVLEAAQRSSRTGEVVAP
ncbi:Gfo/Idh/MocA family oxidoreductase [Kitasatospora phosalacinea]|uniref:Gfo/Idh/MocA family oxidoreductase n=1 Tax=Kitasatospora phosalacinea TaxID=2065 RepID=A0ABW6GVH0_9ACTN